MMTRIEAEFKAYISERNDRTCHYVAARNADGSWRVDSAPIHAQAYAVAA